MRNYDGSLKWERIEAALHRDGYAPDFSCASFNKPPADFDWSGLEGGWEMRRKLKAYCAAHAITDFRIVRNGSYLKDLHGGCVYELWTRRPLHAAAVPG